MQDESTAAVISLHCSGWVQVGEGEITCVDGGHVRRHRHIVHGQGV